MKILNLGSLNIDYVYTVQNFVSPGETISAISYQIFPGGKGLNQSIALAKAGANVFHFGAIGENSEFLFDTLKNNNVNTKFIEKQNKPSGHAIIQVNKKGENCIIIYPGTNKQLSIKNLKSAFANFAQGDYFLTQNETNLVPEALKIASAKKIITAFNPAPMSKEVKNFPLHLVNTIILNQTEAKAIFGSVPLKKDDLSAVMKKFGFKEIIITLGSEGSVFYNGTEFIQQKAFKVKSVDSTAAGDTFIGFYLAQRMKNSPPKTCLQIASAASAICVQRKGAANSIPQLEDVIAFLKKHS